VNDCGTVAVKGFECYSKHFGPGYDEKVHTTWLVNHPLSDSTDSPRTLFNRMAVSL
jgi:hypothetical protein